MSAAATDRALHLGIDLGATNLKWATVERTGADWRVVDEGQVPTPAADGPEAVVARIVEVAREAVACRPGIASVGIGVPGLYDPATGSTRFLVNIPGDWAGRPVGAAGRGGARDPGRADQRRAGVRPGRAAARCRSRRRRRWSG